MLIGFSVSLGVETWQYFGVTGRDASLTDVLANTLGSLHGALSAPALRASARPDPARASALVVVAAAGAMSPLLGLMRPTAPIYLHVEPKNEGATADRC
jgi:glycopeptide antibiotics resistance protein